MLGTKGIPFPAGIENFVEQTGSRLAKRGHEVTVFVRPYVDVSESYRGMRTKRLPSVPTKHLDALTHTFLGTLDVLWRDVDVVHYHALGPSVFSGIPRLRGRATIAHVHGLDWQRAKWSSFAKACLRGGELASVYFPQRTISISRTLKDYLEARYRKPVDYVPTGVRIGESCPPNEIRRLGLEEGSYILFLSRLVPEKGCHYLIEAYKALAPGKKLVIAGPSSHSDDYAEPLKAHASRDIIFTGAVSGALLDELYANAYLYVLPSEIEGLPHALLEGMSFGRCVLASDIEPNLEALGGCGVTFRSQDVSDLTEKLRALLDNPDLVRERASGARERVREHYSWEHVVDRLEQIYAQCANGVRA